MVNIPQFIDRKSVSHLLVPCVFHVSVLRFPVSICSTEISPRITATTLNRLLQLARMCSELSSPVHTGGKVDCRLRRRFVESRRLVRHCRQSQVHTGDEVEKTFDIRATKITHFRQSRPSWTCSTLATMSNEPATFDKSATKSTVDFAASVYRAW